MDLQRACGYVDELTSERPILEQRSRESLRAILAAHDKRGSVVALAVAEDALAAFPDDIQFLAAKGRQLTLLRRFDEAEICLAHALTLAPEDATVLLHLAQLFVTLGRYEEASLLIESALATPSPAPLSLARAGRLLHQMGHYLEASDLLAKAAASDPAPSMTLHLESALTALADDAAAGAAPGDKAPLRQAIEKLRRGEPGLAQPIFAKLTSDRPDFAPGWLGLRGALEVQGRLDEARALKSAWASASPKSSWAINAATRRALSARGLVFDPRSPIPIRSMSETLQPVRSGEELLTKEDAYLVLDPGGASVAHDPVVSLDGTGEDQLPVRYRTAPKYLASLQNAALVGEGLVLTEGGQMISELIPPTRSTKYAGTRQADVMTLDPTRFRDGMGAVRIFERPALLMCGPTDASFGDWIINFPPRLAFAEAAGLHDLTVVVRHQPQAQALAILAALGVGPERIIFHDPEGVSLFSRLMVPSWPTPAKLAPSAGVYDIYRRAVAKPASAERPLLYLTRRNVSSRQMMNEDIVCELFNSRGFLTVDPGSLSFPEVRELFANPACVAGPFGSAFHNLAFSSGKPTNLVLLPDHTQHHLAEIALWHGDLGLRFGYLWGRTLAGAEMGAGKRHAPWIAPLEQLDQAIDTVLELAFAQPSSAAPS